MSSERARQIIGQIAVLLFASLLFASVSALTFWETLRLFFSLTLLVRLWMFKS